MAPLINNNKLCASFHHHMWIQTGVTVRKPLSWLLTSVTLTFDLWPWPYPWTSLLSLVITPENFMMIRWWEHSQKRVTDGQTDGRLYCIFDISIRWSCMHHILLRHIYVVFFLQLFSLIGSFHLIRLIVFNTADLLIIPLIFQHRKWSSNNTVDFPIIQSIFQHNNWSSNDTVADGWMDRRTEPFIELLGCS